MKRNESRQGMRSRPWGTGGLLTLALACSGAVFAQGDLPVTTTRVKAAPGVNADTKGTLNLSDQPRYYLDTIDNLSRDTNDVTRNAPGLAKNNYIPKVYAIRNTNAIEIQSYLLRSLAYEGGIVEVMGAADVKDGTAGVQYLFVTAPDFMIPGITEIVQQCDRAGFKYFDQTGLDFGGGPGAIAYVGKHRTASELTAILAGTELGNIGVFLYPPFADDSTNTIYIADNPTDIADDKAALALFDRPPLQIELDVTIYEIDEGDRGKLGLDWDAWKRHLTGTFDYTSISGNQFFDEDGDVWTTILTLDARILADFLNYTVQRGTSRVVTSTKITMVNSEDIPGGLAGGARGASTAVPARIQSIVPIPFASIDDATGPVNSSNAWNENLLPFEGVRVDILPFIGTESITLTVDATVNSLLGFSKETDAPLINTRTLHSVVNLPHGQPVVLGGLEKINSVKSRVGIPLLKDIPVVQYLFSKESKNTVQSKVLVVLRPRLKASDTETASKL